MTGFKGYLHGIALRFILICYSVFSKNDKFIEMSKNWFYYL